MLSWANQFDICCFLDNNQYNSQYNSYECLLAVNATKFFEVKSNEKCNFIDFKAFLNTNNDWIFGHISYDIKNSIYPNFSSKKDELHFPELFFFIPSLVIKLFNNKVEIETIGTETNNAHEEIINQTISKSETQNPPIQISPKISKEIYLNIIKKIQHHIQLGDCYEMNFCQEFFANNAIIDPLKVYQKLNEISPTPFSSYYKIKDKYVLCASPERYIRKEKSKIISQPIKGTAKRNTLNKIIDDDNKKNLLKSQKERSENVMIVDLVRNDLSKISQRNSVNVDELFGIYSFPQVHQMISSISATIKDNINIADVIRNTFPMGSMTGAPKYKVMELTEHYEQSKRGVYSGSIGYINPNGDFDFNVVIRSIFYNSQTKYLSYQVGGAITHYSHPEDEYQECLLKAKAMEKALK